MSLRKSIWACECVELWHFFFLCKLRIWLDLSGVALEVWSRWFHVFLFNNVNITPTLDDVCTILDHSPPYFYRLAFPLSICNPITSICQYFNLGESKAQSICIDNKHVHLHKGTLLSYLQHRPLSSHHICPNGSLFPLSFIKAHSHYASCNCGPLSLVTVSIESHLSVILWNKLLISSRFGWQALKDGLTSFKF